jgi:NAD(P)-dependent dehydrogenase (short-subunit alcohol dehydrogenase family)
MFKKIVITGGTSGIGLESARQLAALGHELLIIARSEEAYNKAFSSIARETPGVKMHFYKADMSLISNVKEAAYSILKEHDSIDVMLNNAGAVYSDFELSDIGVEKTMTTNHLSHYILTGMLLPLLRKSKNARIVNVSSDSHYKGNLDFKPLTQDTDKYFIMKAYESSKLANVLFTYYLAEKLKPEGITVNCLHPGMVNTSIGGKSEHWLHKIAWNTLSSLLGISVVKGAATNVYLTISEDVDGISGKYFFKCKSKPSLKLSYDLYLQKQLWEWSERITGFYYQLDTN